VQVLENFHVATAFQLMKQQDMNLLGELSIADAVRCCARRSTGHGRTCDLPCIEAVSGKAFVHACAACTFPPVVGLVEQTYVRQLAITIVLATDLALSFDIVGKFKLTFGNKDLKLEGAKEIKETKDMLLKMVPMQRPLLSVDGCMHVCMCLGACVSALQERALD
jgi:hypothetical protein